MKSYWKDDSRIAHEHRAVFGGSLKFSRCVSSIFVYASDKSGRISRAGEAWDVQVPDLPQPG